MCAAETSARATPAARRSACRSATTRPVMPSPRRNVTSAFPPGGPSDATISISPLGVEQRDRASHDTVMALENAEHLMQCAFLVRRRGQRLTDFEKCGQSPKLARMAARLRFGELQPRCCARRHGVGPAVRVYNLCGTRAKLVPDQRAGISRKTFAIPSIPSRVENRERTILKRNQKAADIRVGIRRSESRCYGTVTSMRVPAIRTARLSSCSPENPISV